MPRQPLTKGGAVSVKEMAEIELAGDCLGEQSLFGTKIAIDERRIGSCSRRDITYADLIVTVMGKTPAR
jgi:hypothetical protein